MGKVCVLAECVERDITMTRFPSVKAAQQAMYTQYMETVFGAEEFARSEYAGKEFPECLEEIKDDPILYEAGDAEIFAMSAYVNDGPNHDNYDWSIQEV